MSEAIRQGTFDTKRNCTVHVCDEVQVFYPAHKLVEVGVVGEIGNLLFAQQRLCLDRMPFDRNLTAFKLKYAADSFDCGRFTRAVMPDEPAGFTRRNVNRQVINGTFVAISFR
jgi:hypothetical protein